MKSIRDDPLTLKAALATSASTLNPGVKSTFFAFIEVMLMTLSEVWVCLGGWSFMRSASGLVS